MYNIRKYHQLFQNIIENQLIASSMYALLHDGSQNNNNRHAVTVFVWV